MSRMDPLERADRLKREADLILQKVGVFEILRPHGRIVPTGSYFLDVMAYPDIDLYISRVNIDRLFEIGGRLAGSDLVFQVVFEKSDDPRLPGGLYLKPRIRYGEWERPWKIDIWSLEDQVIDQLMQPMHHFKTRMTTVLREQIVRYKLSVMTGKDRPPRYSGYFIYKAFIDEGMTEFSAVTEYLVANGIRMDGS